MSRTWSTDRDVEDLVDRQNGALCRLLLAGPADPAGVAAHETVVGGRVQDRVQEPVRLRRGRLAHADVTILLPPRPNVSLVDLRDGTGAEGRQEVDPEYLVVAFPRCLAQVPFGYPPRGVLPEWNATPIRVEPVAASQLRPLLCEPICGVSLRSKVRGAGRLIPSGPGYLAWQRPDDSCRIRPKSRLAVSMPLARDGSSATHAPARSARPRPSRPRGSCSQSNELDAPLLDQALDVPLSRLVKGTLYRDYHPDSHRTRVDGVGRLTCAGAVLGVSQTWSLSAWQSRDHDSTEISRWR